MDRRLSMWAVTQDVSSAALANIKESNQQGGNLNVKNGTQSYTVCNTLY